MNPQALTCQPYEVPLSTSATIVSVLPAGTAPTPGVVHVSSALTFESAQPPTNVHSPTGSPPHGWGAHDGDQSRFFELHTEFGQNPLQQSPALPQTSPSSTLV